MFCTLVDLLNIFNLFIIFYSFDKITGGSYQYSYNPCYSFTEGDGACYKAAVSLYRKNSVLN